MRAWEFEKACLKKIEATTELSPIFFCLNSESKWTFGVIGIETSEYIDEYESAVHTKIQKAAMLMILDADDTIKVFSYDEKKQAAFGIPVEATYEFYGVDPDQADTSFIGSGDNESYVAADLALRALKNGTLEDAIAYRETFLEETPEEIAIFYQKVFDDFFAYTARSTLQKEELNEQEPPSIEQEEKDVGTHEEQSRADLAFEKMYQQGKQTLSHKHGIRDKKQLESYREHISRWRITFEQAEKEGWLDRAVKLACDMEQHTFLGMKTEMLKEKLQAG